MAKQTDLERLQSEYRVLVPQATAFLEELTRQVSHIVKNTEAALAFPIQHRVKTWSSIEAKFQALSPTLKKVQEIQDIVGLRIVLLFQRDMSAVSTEISHSLRVLRSYDTGDRLQQDQFGYVARHFVVGVPDEWARLPTMKGLNNFIAEIQVRTLAQHMWAEASHILQYKKEQSVPPEIRRSLSRSSALLETIDLEFDRVLSERERYREKSEYVVEEELLNVDLLEVFLNSVLPIKNRIPDDDYSELLINLKYFEIRTVGDLRALITEQLDAAKKEDASYCALAKKKVEQGIEEYEDLDISEDRLKSGVYFSYVGLVRTMLQIKFGDIELKNMWNSMEEFRDSQEQE